MNFIKTLKTITIFLSVICIFFSQSAQATLFNGLIAWYPFNGNSNDFSGNANHAIVKGAKLSEDLNGFKNSAYSFDGINDYIYIPDNPLINFGTNAFSISVWIKNNQPGIWKRIITKRKAANDGNWYSLALHDGYSIFEINASTNFKSTEQINDNIWHFITIIRDVEQNQFLMYIDGTYNTSMSDEGLNLNSGDRTSIEIGRWAYEKYNGTIYSGSIDNIRIHSRALSENEVLELYHTDNRCKMDDSDDDGVVDIWDECPETPENSYVNKNGCPEKDSSAVSGRINLKGQALTGGSATLIQSGELFQKSHLDDGYFKFEKVNEEKSINIMIRKPIE